MGTIKERYTLFLKALERFTKTDIRYLLSGGAWLTIGQISIAGIAFVSSLAFAHFVPKETYGTYRFLLSFFWTLTAFGLTGIPTALVRSIAQGKDGAYWVALRFSLLGSIPLVLCSFVLAAYYAIQGNYLLVAGSLIIGIIGPGMQASYLYGPVLEGKRAFSTNAIAGFFLNLVPFLGLITVMSINAHTPATVYLAVYLGLSVATAAVISMYVIRSFTYSVKNSGSKEFKILGIHLSAMNILFTLSQQIDKLMVFHVLGAVELAVYTFATAIPDQLRALFGTLETLSMPKFAQRSISEVAKTLKSRISLLTIGVAAIVGLYILSAPLIFRLLFPAYTDSILFSQLYALSLIPIGSVVPVSLLQAHAAKRELYIYNTLIPVFQIATVAYGVYSFGIIGVVLSRIATRTLGLVVSLILVRNLSRRSVSAT